MDPDTVYADPDPYTFPMLDNGFKARLNKDARMAHMMLFVEAYRRGVVAGGPSALREPACVSEMVDKLLDASNPRVIKARDFLDATVDFNPVRTPAFAGRRYSP